VDVPAPSGKGASGTPGRRTPPELPVALVPPPLSAAAGPARYLMRMPGVGGTGVVTVSQILQMAALLDGKHSAGLDQTGLAQKGGAVISDVRISDTPIDAGVRASRASIDVLLGLDPLGAASPATLAACDPARTVAVVNTGLLATAAMVTGTAGAGRDTGGSETGDLGPARQLIDAATRVDGNIYLDAQALSQALFGDHMPANLLLLGAAFQAGYLPVSEASITGAIELNGAAVAANLAAFAWGRAFVLDPEAVLRAAGQGDPPPEAPTAQATRLTADAGLPDELGELLALRVSDLIGYQSAGYARTYLDAVRQVHATEARVLGPQARAITEAYARGLHKLMAYKDEYEVARLHLLDAEEQRRTRALGPGGRVQIMLHPPVLRALGLNRKIALGPASRPALEALRAGKRLRGTRLDPFGATQIRRLERQLIEEYRDFMTDALSRLSAANADVVRELAATPDLIRGYEEVKLRNVALFRDRVRELAAASASVRKIQIF
jgi:indolepyruvate ferredoxin oxidoreductase